MSASTTSPRTISSRVRWQLLGGDRFYIAARWGVFILLALIGTLLVKQPLWPFTLTMPPVLMLVWAYGLFNLLATLALFVSALSGLLNIAFVIDIIFISLFTYFGHDPRDLYYPLYLLPLVGAAFRLRPMSSLLAGVFAAAVYVSAYLLARIGPNNGPAPTEAVALLGLTLRAVALVCIPWLTSGLAERWTANNRLSVELAEQKQQDALSEANAYRDQMRSLYEVAYTLSTTMNYQSVLDATLVESRKLVPHQCALVLLSTGQPDELYVAASYGASDLDTQQRLQLGTGQIGQVLRSSDACLIDDVSQEPELAPIAALAQCHAACLVPLRAALRTYGLLLIASDRARAFNTEQLGMLTALANYAIIALHNAQLVYDLRQERSKLLSKEEEVRHQLARDLHDGPAQALAAITMNVEFIKRLLERDPKRVFNELDKLGQLAKRTTHEVRTMLFELRPLALETQGLDVTLRQYLERFQSNTTKIELESNEISVDLDTKVEGTLFNIIQEAINNALKYAKAEHIWVRLKQTPSALEVTVQDDGAGFDLQKVLESYEKRGSFGLLNIEERAKLIGGASEMMSAPGQGTTVRVTVPLI
ncbi:MAG TPA: GAF domain-containing sensor histidine kinase [Kouleothrix sp.]|uniref:GAF domain-containing sensor histidine kinase n=1 Tax=Kouleothrix sp. TaxID=2779161 RepID=UPI002CCC7029|nr:GAF domain-containing sensor histidine kinase [Kouleothrix sp.]HRC74479.1 GAF domain-containing sensor histidine kinase [Kouleothrix sp.]